MKVKLTEAVLGKRPPLATPQMGFSPDGNRVGWAARDGAKTRIEINCIAVFTAERVEQIFFTPDSNHWIAIERRGPKWVVVFDGRAGPLLDRVQNFVFSPASDRIGYVGTRGTRQVAVVDGIESAEHDFVVGLTWAGDGRVMFAAYDGGTAQLVIDGARIGQSYKKMSVPMVSEGGNSVATAVQRSDGRELVVVNGTEGSPHGKTFDVAMTRDGKRTAYVGHDDVARVYVDEKPGAVHADAGPIVFSPDGKRVAYVAKTEDDRMLVVIDGTAERKHVRVDALRFSPDSKRVMYVASDKSRSVVVVDSVEVGPFEAVTRSVMFGAGGAKWAAIVGKKGKQLVVVDGISGKPYDSVDQPIFSADGRVIAYGARRSGRTLVVINGTEFDWYKEATRVGGPPRFVYDRLITFLHRGDEVVRVEAEIRP